MLIASPISQMFKNLSMPHEMEEKVHLSNDVMNHFKDLEMMLNNKTNDITIKKACSEALVGLEEILRNIKYFSTQPDGVEAGQIWRFKTMVSTDFVRLVQTEHPIALVLVAHFAAAASPIQTLWYSMNWGEYVIRGIAMSLDESMHHWLDWPQEQMRNGLKAVVGNVSIYRSPQQND